MEIYHFWVPPSFWIENSFCCPASLSRVSNVITIVIMAMKENPALLARIFDNNKRQIPSSFQFLCER